ncbi:ABC transporter ATP-binding protein [Aminobacter anthyllidis]|uniref:ABC transporter ATP-binding protein n=1 Tax=Aminobacter anthyllidis TaxID=1035067 RepID=A0A9X1AH04_9HYPH|nr:TOBE domain-containing protein [Aminobacter anthyllidis]MBT1159461.1 ABC transporter ATP-binding protein [Aminobacter anthyllidis]
MIYVTHDQVEAMTLADRIVVLKEGRVMQQGSPYELYERPANLFVAQFIGSPKMNVLACAPSGDAKLDLAGQGTLSLAFSGAPTQLGARPEHLTLVAPDNGNCRGTVEVAEYLGGNTSVFIRNEQRPDKCQCARGHSSPHRRDGRYRNRRQPSDTVR